MTERRRSPRFEKSLPLVLRGAAASESQFSMKDVSKRGFRVETSAALAVGEAIGFEMTLPGTGLIEGKAKVRWAAASGAFGIHEAGLEIVDLRWGQAAALGRFLEPVTAGVNLLALLDTLLQCGCALVVFLAAKEVFQHRPDLLRQYGSWMLEVGPLYFVVAAAGLGILALLRR